ncbi:MAG: peptidylprolyl isomerase [Acidimicrobiales bacterium]|nr:peptidylprolyl isomerase [Acidimicrobiales bacterium]
MEAARRRRTRLIRGGIVVVLFGAALGILYAVRGGGSSQAACQAGPSPTTRHYSSYPPTVISAQKHYVATVCTDVGTFTMSLDATAAPKTVNNFVYLADHRFYNGLRFHRVIPGFVVQGGDPQGNGSGGPGYKFADELPKAGSYKLGSVAMANSGPNTNGSQFFVVVGKQGESLQPNYSLFGQVTSGMPVVQRIARDGSTSGKPKVVHKMLDVTISAS